MAPVELRSPEISSASLHAYRPVWMHLYTTPFAVLYPVLAYAYYVRYDDWIASEEWTFVFTVGLVASHALSFLATRWSVRVRAALTCRSVARLEDAECVCVMPLLHRGRAEIVPISRNDESDPASWTFVYQHETYVVLSASQPPVFAPIPYPCASSPELGTYLAPAALRPTPDVPSAHKLYGANSFDIPIPTFPALFAEHAVAPFFVFQIFCVGLWMLDEYWYYSLFTLFMLVVFECTVVFQRLKTLQEFRTMSVKPYPIQCFRDGKWDVVQTNELYPGDVVSITRGVDDRSIPADLLLLSGTVIVNEAMLSGESTPLVKESIQLRERDERLDIDGAHKNNVLFGGTKALQCTKAGELETARAPATPDGGALACVLRTGFGTAQGKLVRTMIFSTERVSANNAESFLFIGFLLVFAIAASWYVWVKGIEREMAKGKLLLDCVLIVTSVVPPELPMELSLAVNASLVALSKYAIFCTEPFRIPYAGKVDVCCFDKTGTITQESLVLDGVAGVMPGSPRELVPVTKAGAQTMLCLAAAHALVCLEDGTIVGDPMERATLDALQWELDAGKMDVVVPRHKGGPVQRIEIKRRFQFSSALKRMSTVSLAAGRTLVAVKGAPETIRGMLSVVPPAYDDTFKWFTRRGARVLALGWKEAPALSNDKINKMHRDEIEAGLTFGGFLVFQCPLKPDAVEVLKMLGDASHRCIMITGDNPLTAVHVAREVEIVDREALILDLREGATNARDLTWRTVDEQTVIAVDPDAELDAALLAEYDVCITGAALAQYTARPDAMAQLVQHALVYARVSPAQKESVLAALNALGFCTLMAGDGTNDVGALKAAHIGVALLEGTLDDLKKIAEHQRIERIKSVYESQLKISARFGQPPPPPPAALRDAYPELVNVQQDALRNMQTARQRNPMERFDLASITDRLADMGDEDEVPKIKLGDASCAAPFTSKLANVSAIAHIIRQGRCTLVATIQMYKILALNCLISAYSLSVQYLDGIKYGDYQVTITGMLMSICFLFISRAKPVEQLSRERPLTNIFNLYVVLSVLLQFAVHIAALLYITDLSNRNEDRGPIDLEAKFEPSLLNTAVYLLSLSQQVSTFAINFQGRPFREGIRENPALYYGLLGASAVAFSGATDFMPEMNRWLQIVEMTMPFKVRLTSTMAADFVLCFIIEHGCKALFADLRPREFIERGMERRLRRRAVEREEKRLALENGVVEKKTQ